MSVKEIKMFTVVCDNCNKSADEDTDYCAWNDEGAAKDVAMNADYIVEGIKHYCPSCYSYDEEDNLIIKKK